jgi:hypothetical protein
MFNAIGLKIITSMDNKYNLCCAYNIKECKHKLCYESSRCDSDKRRKEYTT